MSDKILKKDFIDDTLLKIQKVLNLILEYHEIEMVYNIDERNKLFCEVIKKTKKDLTSTEMFEKIHKIVAVNESIDKEESEWLSEQIYEYHKDIFLLHYFYAVLYSYNYDVSLRDKITEDHVKKFFLKANEIHKKYKELKNSNVEKT